MNTRRQGSDGPEDVDAAFAEIIADLEREGIGQDVTAGPPEPVQEPVKDPQPPKPAEPASTWRTADQEWDWQSAADDEHYEPPDPPPMPRLRATTVIALILILLGVLLFIAPQLLGLGAGVAIPIATISALAGAGLLLLRLRTGTPPGHPDSGDDGAQV
jgi:hypothetical protein